VLHKVRPSRISSPSSCPFPPLRVPLPRPLPSLGCSLFKTRVLYPSMHRERILRSWYTAALHRGRLLRFTSFTPLLFSFLTHDRSLAHLHSRHLSGYTRPARVCQLTCAGRCGCAAEGRLWARQSAVWQRRWSLRRVVFNQCHLCSLTPRSHLVGGLRFSSHLSLPSLVSVMDLVFYTLLRTIDNLPITLSSEIAKKNKELN
jgi:hypothetical protein